jgi:hypothetical protein
MPLLFSSTLVRLTLLPDTSSNDAKVIVPLPELRENVPAALDVPSSMLPTAPKVTSPPELTFKVPPTDIAVAEMLPWVVIKDALPEIVRTPVEITLPVDVAVSVNKIFAPLPDK